MRFKKTPLSLTWIFKFYYRTSSFRSKGEAVLLRFLAAVHAMRMHCTQMAEMAQSNLHIKFSALNVDFNSLSSDPLCLRSPP